MREAATEEEGEEADGDVGGPGIGVAPGEMADDVGLDDKRNNRETVDDPNTQKLSWAEIEELKRKGGGNSGRVGVLPSFSMAKSTSVTVPLTSLPGNHHRPDDIPRKPTPKNSLLPQQVRPPQAQ